MRATVIAMTALVVGGCTLNYTDGKAKQEGGAERTSASNASGSAASTSGSAAAGSTSSSASATSSTGSTGSSSSSTGSTVASSSSSSGTAGSSGSSSSSTAGSSGAGTTGSSGGSGSSGSGCIGDGGFISAGAYSGGFANLRSVVIGDFTGDGQVDLGVPAANMYVLPGYPDGGFRTPPWTTTISPSATATGTVAGDFNRDGVLDIAFVSTTQLYVLDGWGDGTFQDAGIYGSFSNSFAIAGGNFNGDGSLDLAIADTNGGRVVIYLGDSTGGFTQAAASLSHAYPMSVATGDFNLDGVTDLVTANSTDNVSIFIGYGDGGFQGAIDHICSSLNTPRPYWVVADDFNGDGRLDLAVANSNTKTVSILRGYVDAGFSLPTDYDLGNASAESLATGDFNHDGVLDLAVGSFPGLSVLLGFGDGGFQPAVFYPLNLSGTYTVATGDFNGDGFLDLATASSNGGNGVVDVFLNVGCTP